MAKKIDYKKIMHFASLDAIKNILDDVSKNGLPGEHHFYITFDMCYTGVKTSDSLKHRYPVEMTIVIQNWYDEFIVNDNSFSIILNFGNVRERMQIPFLAIKSFIDPSVDFGLTFEKQVNSDGKTTDNNRSDISNSENYPHSEKPRNGTSKKGGEVVNLESFRKT